jgi:hypothetical protein
MKVYDQDYVKICRSTIDSNLKAYDKAIGKGGRDDKFEERFFNSQVLLPDYMFVYRLSGIGVRSRCPQHFVAPPNGRPADLGTN